MAPNTRTMYAAKLNGVGNKPYCVMYELVLPSKQRRDLVFDFHRQFDGVPDFLSQMTNPPVAIDRDSYIRVYRTSELKYYSRMIQKLEFFCEYNAISLITDDEARVELTNLLPHIIKTTFKLYIPRLE